MKIVYKLKSNSSQKTGYPSSHENTENRQFPSFGIAFSVILVVYEDNLTTNFPSTWKRGVPLHSHKHQFVDQYTYWYLRYPMLL